MSICRNINEAELKKDPAAKAFVEMLFDNEEDLRLDGSSVYHQFPIYSSADDSRSTVHVLLISPQHGGIVVSCIDLTDRELSKDEFDQIKEDLVQVYSIIFSSLVKSPYLRPGKNIGLMGLRYPFVPALFALNYSGNKAALLQDGDEVFVLTCLQDVTKLLEDKSIDDPLDQTILDETISIIEGSKAIPRRKERRLRSSAEWTKGKILHEIDTQIAVWDQEQKRAALYILDAPQRLRGLAGSGKTIVLAMRAARIHLQNPDATILYTFWTKSLYSLVKRYITRFYRLYADTDPDWDKVQILHAWGGRSLPGVYYNVCLSNGIEPKTLRDSAGFKNSFDSICKSLCEQQPRTMFDYALLDEGQDFPIHFYRLCRMITKENRVSWGYDECQNVLNVEMQDERETYGRDSNGEYYIDFRRSGTDEKQDLVLHVCYRNPRKTLVLAFALGLGLYNNRIIQMPENNAHWEDLGFKILKGESNVGDAMVIERPEQNSPLVMNKHLETDDVVKMQVFDSIQEECKFVADAIKDDIDNDLRPDDILVICIDDRYARSYFEQLTQLLESKDIGVFNLLEAPSNVTEFQIDDYVTLTTVYRAKGNEAGSVYIMGIDSVFNNKNSIQERNKIFTAITRSKAWVTLTGTGDAARECEKEVIQVMHNYPQLCFEMPDRDSLKVFQRGLTEKQSDFNRLERNLQDLASQYDLTIDEIIERLRRPKKS